MATHSHQGGNPDPHVIEQGADFSLLRAVYYDDAMTSMPDLATWTATYVVFPDRDPSQAPVVKLGTSAGMTVRYNDGASTTTTTTGVTLGVNGVGPVSTTVLAAVADGATTISVTSATGLAIGDTLVIWLDDGTLHVTSIANLAGTTVTLATALGGAAASGKTVRRFDPAWFVHNIELHLPAATTRSLTDWGTGLYQIHLIDPFGRTQRVMDGTCCLERGHGNG